MNIHTGKYIKYYDVIRQCYSEGKSAEEIIKIINDPSLNKKSQIYSIASRIGVSNNKARCIDKFSEIDKKALNLINQGLSHTKVAKILNVDQQSMTRRLKEKFGIEVLPDGKKHINSDFFNDVDNEEKAYWLGFLYADGYIDESKNVIELALNERDINHIKKFKNSLESDHKISYRKIRINESEHKSVRITFKDKKICDSLIRLGCIQNKSLKLESLPQLCSLEMYRAFIRGYFDGDGSIYRNKSHMSVSFTSGSLMFLKSIQAFLIDILKIKSWIKKDVRTNAYDLTILSTHEGYLFLKYIYDNSVYYLDRKYEQYQLFCRSENILQDSLNDEDGIKRGWRNVD